MSAADIALLIATLIAAAYLTLDALNDRCGLASVCEPIIVAVKRMWLQHHIKAWTRDLDVIQRDRDNSYQVEKIIHQEIAIAKSQLRALSKNEI